MVGVFAVARVPPWGAGIQHHLHNDNPHFEHLRWRGFLGGFSCDVSILESLFHIQNEICGLEFGCSVFDEFAATCSIFPLGHQKKGI